MKKSSGDFIIDTEFTETLRNDIVCIANYKTAIDTGTHPVEALKNNMFAASQSAIQYVQSMDAKQLSTDEFAIAQTKAQVAAWVESLGNKNGK